MPHIDGRDPIETHERMARLEEQAAAAYASEISTTSDPERREWLANKARRSKESAQFHHDRAAALRGKPEGS